MMCHGVCVQKLRDKIVVFLETILRTVPVYSRYQAKDRKAWM